MAQRQHHTVLYDADCGFCRWCLAGLLSLDRQRRLRPVALGTPEADALLAPMSPERQFASWHLVDPDGRVGSAGAALPSALRLIPGGRLPGAVLGRLPALSEHGYGWVAGHRSQLGRFVSAGARTRADTLIAARQAELRAESG